MKGSQWFILGIGLILLSSYLFINALGWGSCTIHDGDLLIACTIRRYAYAVPGVISFVVGWIAVICGFLEGKE